MGKISSLSNRASLLICLSFLFLADAAAQEKQEEIPVSTAGRNWFETHGVFNHLDAAVTAGTTGIGFELATPVTKWVRLRAGYDFMPHFHFNSSYEVSAYANGKVNDSNFGAIQEKMHQVTGYDLQKSVTMQNTMTFHNWKVLVDVYPFQNNRRWRFTAGLYGGPKRIGKCINLYEEAPMLVSIGTYNHLYDMATAPDFVVKYSWDEKFLGIAYLDADEAQTIQNTMLKYGRLGVHMGNHKDGTPYFMEPDKDGSLSARAIVNALRPYAGFGYEGGLDKEGRWQAGLDAGVMFWGGSPKIVTHDGTVLNDLTGLRHKVKRQMDLIKGVAVYPVLNFRLSYSLF